MGQGEFSPKHSQGWDHMVYIVKGDGVIFIDGVDYAVSGDSAAFISGGKEHQFKQKGKDELAFMRIGPSYPQEVMSNQLTVWILIILVLFRPVKGILLTATTFSPGKQRPCDVSILSALSNSASLESAISILIP